ncbi:MAG: SGNH/GDSL hydrolase family protein [Pirellulales bacterium]
MSLFLSPNPLRQRRPAVFVAAIVAACFGTAAASIGDDEGPLPGPIRLRLPPTLYAVVGQETNLYFDNVVLTTRPDHYAFDAVCAHGRQQAERWTWTPGEQDVGQHRLAIEVRDESNGLVARAQTTVMVSAADAGADRPLSVLMIGDSLTHASVYPAHLLKLCQPAGNPRVELVGSFQPAGAAEGVRHEGYGGWTARRFATHFTGTARAGDYKQRGSPFLYLNEQSEQRLDFMHYCRDVNGGKSPDVVSIFLGPNDIFGATDSNLEQTIDDMLLHLAQLVEMIRSASPQTVVALMLPVPPASSQDAFGGNYASGQTRWQYKRNQHRLVERMLDQFADGSLEGVSIVPTSVNLDCLRNYPATSAAANARNSQALERQSNAVHPATSGYEQIGDTLYAWLKDHASRMSGTP